MWQVQIPAVSLAVSCTQIGTRHSCTIHRDTRFTPIAFTRYHLLHGDLRYVLVFSAGRPVHAFPGIYHLLRAHCKGRGLTRGKYHGIFFFLPHNTEHHFSLPTLLISECVLIYMDAAESVRWSCFWAHNCVLMGRNVAASSRTN